MEEIKNNQNLNSDNDEKKESTASKWVPTIFGVIAYVIAKFAIFDGDINFLGGVLSFVVGAAIGYGVVYLFSKK
jgi:hypothetical protein